MKRNFLKTALAAALFAVAGGQQVMAQDTFLTNPNDVPSGYYYVVSSYNESYAWTVNGEGEFVVDELDETDVRFIFYATGRNTDNETTKKQDGKKVSELGTQLRIRFFWGTPDWTDFSSDPKVFWTLGGLGANSNQQVLKVNVEYGMHNWQNVTDAGFRFSASNRGYNIAPQNGTFAKGQKLWYYANNTYNDQGRWKLKAVSDAQITAVEATTPEAVIARLAAEEAIPNAIEAFIALKEVAALIGTEVAHYDYTLTSEDNELLAGAYDQAATYAGKDAVALKTQFETLANNIKATLVKVTTGYYYMINQYDQIPDDGREVTVFALGENAIFGDYLTAANRNNARYIWKLETTSTDDVYKFSNWLTGHGFNNGRNTGQQAQLTSTSATEVKITYPGDGSVQILVNKDNSKALFIRNSNWFTNATAELQQYPQCGHNTTGQNGDSEWNGLKGSDNLTNHFWALEEVPATVISSLEVYVNGQSEILAKVTELKNQIKAARTEGLAAYSRTIDNATELSLTYDGTMFDSNSGQGGNGNNVVIDGVTNPYGTDGNGYQGLDPSGNTYFHTANSSYIAKHYDDADTELTPYGELASLSFELASAVDNIGFAFYPRQNQNDFDTPTTIDVLVSSDGQNWTLVSQPYALYDAETYAANTPVFVGPFDFGGDYYKYIRFRSYSCRRNNNNANYFNLGGLKAYTGMEIDPACQAATIDAAIIDGLSTALGNAVIAATRAESVANLETASAELSTALEAFRDAFKKIDVTPVAESQGFATFYSDYAVSIPAGVTAYTGYVNAANNNESFHLTEVAGTVIPANSAVILKGTEGTKYTFAKIDNSDAPLANNDLKGVTADTDASSIALNGGTLMTLQKINDVVGLYSFTGTTLAANKAYLVLPASSPVRSLTFSFGEETTTGVQGVKEVKNDNGKFYNLSGQRVMNPTKGLYIVNGKKVVIK